MVVFFVLPKYPKMIIPSLKSDSDVMKLDNSVKTFAKSETSVNNSNICIDQSLLSNKGQSPKQYS